MDWLLIPGILGIVLILTAIYKWRDVENGFVSVVIVILIICIFLAFIICPVNYYKTKTDSIEAEAYWDTFISPNIIEETDEYITIKNINAGIWQSGGYNLASFNQYLKSTRYWDSMPVLGTCVYPPKNHLKLVKVSLEE